MSFQPDADPNYQAYLKQRNRLDANLAENFDQGVIEYLCSQATATGTINAAMVNNAIALGLTTAKRNAPTF